MGSRTTWKVITNDDAALWLYSHWGGESKFEDTKDALLKSQPRWGDRTYGARIFVSSIVGESWSEETGFGLAATLADSECPFEESYDLVVVDFTTNTITYGRFEFSFEEFLADTWAAKTSSGKTTFDTNYQNRANARLGATEGVS